MSLLQEFDTLLLFSRQRYSQQWTQEIDGICTCTRTSTSWRTPARVCHDEQWRPIRPGSSGPVRLFCVSHWSPPSGLFRMAL